MSQSGPLPPLAQIPPQIASVADYEPCARARMTPAAWAYFNGGAADGITQRENETAFQRLRLCNRVLADMQDGHTRLELLGTRLEHPILLAPVASQKLAHPDGELATALAASALKAGMVVSTQASVALEDVASVAQSPLWFQLYLQHDRVFTAELVRRAEVSGYRALVVTVDAPVNGVRNAEQRAGFVMPPGMVPNLNGAQLPASETLRAGEDSLFASARVHEAMRWEDVAWLRGLTRLPVLLKGILHPQDAVRALEYGVDGLVVSNHGGRVLDTLPATIDALPGIAAVVDGRVPLLLDGGIRRGTDVLKALALGADAVMVGRPYIHGLASAGAVGVAHVLHLLRTELEMAMVLTGCKTLADIDRSVIWPTG